MKKKEFRSFLIASCCLMVMVYVLLWSPDSLASEGVGPGRRLWDNIMLWINFGIIVFVFLKYGKRPFMNYLRGARDEVQQRLESVRGQFNETESMVAAETDNLTYTNERIKEIEESLVQRGRKEKEKIIEEAKIIADKMIKDAETYSRYRMSVAKKALSLEMAEMAISMVKEKLSKELTEQDNERLIERFLGGLKTETRSND